MTTPDPTIISVPCSECQAGQLRHKLVTYYTWLGNELVTIPDFPDWVCDVCGRREYDHQALSRMSLLLNTHTSRPKRVSRPPITPAQGNKSHPNR